MKKYLFIILFIFEGFLLRAQVQIQTMLPTVGLVQKNQLWNLVLVNSMGENLQGRVEMVLLDRQYSQEMMTATSAEFSLLKGSMIVNLNSLSPVNYNYSGLEPDRSLNNLLPVGSYSVCYSFVRNAETEKREVLAEECTVFDIEALAPPMLLFPSDSSVTEVNPGQFSWTPPMPSALLNRVQYDVIITEVYPAQKAAEAIEENPPFFNTNLVADNFLNYSAALPVFEKDKWYAWQVVARDHDRYAGKSEVWVFKVSRESEAARIIRGTPYIRMKPGNAETGIAPNGVLKISYENRTADSLVTLEVTDMTGGQAKGGELKIPLRVVAGENQLQVNLKKFMELREGHLYQARITGTAAVMQSILFRIRFIKD